MSKWGADADELGDLPGAFAVDPLFAGGGGEAQGGGEVAGTGEQVASEHEVVGDGAAGEHDVLEGAGEAEGGDAVRCEPHEFPVAEADGSLVHAVHAGQGVEAGGLARSVGADEGVHAARFDGEADSVECDQAGEPYGDVLDDEAGDPGVRAGLGAFGLRGGHAAHRRRVRGAAGSAASPVSAASSPR